MIQQMNSSGAVTAAVVIIDMLSYFEAEGDDDYRSNFMRTAQAIAKLRDLADLSNVLTIYINTHFESLEHFLSSAMSRKSEPHWLGDSKEAEVIPSLMPRPTDCVISKTVNSGFFGTNLDATLRSLSINRLLLTGVHTHVCIALTAADAFYRNYDVVVLSDCVTTMDRLKHFRTLDYIERHLGRVASSADGIGLFT